MADTVRDSAFSPFHLGSVGYRSDGASDVIVHDDSVGSVSSFTAFGVFPGEDEYDYFSFTASGLSSVAVTITTSATGNFSNVLLLAPSSGVTKVSGGVVSTSYGGEHFDSSFQEILDAGAEEALQAYTDPRFQLGIDFEDAIWRQNETITSVWELDGDAVKFDIGGYQFEGGIPRRGVSVVNAEEITYSIEITPLDRSFSDLGGESIVFQDSLGFAEVHSGSDAIDFYRFDGRRSDLSVQFINGNELQAENTRLSSAEDRLIDIERIQLDDGFFAFDLDGNAGQIYRLYQAAFDRDPDVAGLGHWIDTFDRGLFDLTGVAQEFLISEEFQTRFGTEETLSDNDFLTLLYNNVLDRDPDAPGFEFWENQQSQGLSRADILQYFSESEENYNNVAAEIEAGIFYI